MGCVALVFALGLFAASPVLHGKLHHHDSTGSDDGCAIVLFATGVSVPLALSAVPPSAEWREHSYARSTEIFLGSPRYRLLPGCGPPVA